MSAIKEQYPEALSFIEQNTEMLSAASALDMAEEANLPMLARKLSTMSEPEASHLINKRNPYVMFLLHRACKARLPRC
ncbi:hypothetical protein [Vibrio scophthalmi]|uniref:hypothetical protein n=1 Tax=Vibrio scophthalmi TaxID=45658 RepID=UPI000849B476|nr:hypothetical protein [Vibrio scophthalmi]